MSSRLSTPGPANTGRAEGRSFGLLFASVFGLLAGRAYLKGSSEFGVLSGLAICLALAAFLIPAALMPLRRAWMKFGLLLNRVISPIVFSILYFGIVTPFAWIYRRCGNDVLKLRWDRDAKTYWIKRETPDATASTLMNQY